MFKKILDYLYYQYELLAQLIPLFAKIYIKIHRPSVIKEIEMCDISPSDRIIQVGCGAIPYSLITIYKKLKIPLVGIDIKQKAVKKAEYYLKKFDLLDKIKVVKGDGTKYIFTNYDLILISYGAKNTDKVLKNVISNSKKDAKILLRKTTFGNTDNIESILDKYITKRKKMLLTQESIFINKINKK